MQPIPPMRQVRIPVDLDIEQLKSFVEQGHNYGMFTPEEAKGRRPDQTITFLVTTETPITAKQMKDMLAHNHAVALVRGQTSRELMALAASHNMENTAHTPNAAQKLEVSIVEEGNDSDDAFAVGFQISKPVQETVIGSRPSSGRRGGRKGG